jgi:hypothetical protein
VWWKMQQNSSVCTFLLRLEMAMNSWFWEIRDLILQRVWVLLLWMQIEKGNLNNIRGHIEQIRLLRFC